MIILACLFVFQFPHQEQQMFRHQGTVIKVGDEKLQVMRRLGRPDNVLSTEITYISGDPELGQREFVVEQRWFYNFGDRKFTLILNFENKVLTSIERGFYGVSQSNISKCGPPSNRLYGMIDAEILMMCGEPDFIDVSYAHRTEKLGKDYHRQFDIRVEEWTYNFGPNKFLQTLIFENGVLIDAFRGERGW